MQERTVNTPVEVDLGGGKLRLVYDMAAMVTAEEKGYDLSNLEPSITSKPFSTIRFLLWVGSRREHPEYALEDISALVDMKQLNGISGSVVDALRKQLPALEEGRNPPPPPANL